MPTEDKLKRIIYSLDASFREKNKRLKDLTDIDPSDSTCMMVPGRFIDQQTTTANELYSHCQQTKHQPQSISRSTEFALQSGSAAANRRG